MDKLKSKMEGILHKGEGNDKGDENDKHGGNQQDLHVGQPQQQHPMKEGAGATPEHPQSKTPAKAHNQPHAHRPATKRGLCWPVENKRDDPTRFTRPGSKISWYYNWSPHPTPSTAPLSFVPMQWNGGGIADLAHNAASAAAVLAFNEPELPDQANMSTDAAAELWMAHFEPLRRKGVRCGSPGISSAGPAVPWLREFWAKIQRRGGDVDFWALHWYGVELGGFYDYIWSTHHQLDPAKPVWITEFAATNWDEKNPLPQEHVLNFAKESFKYLDTLDWVERYCWFAPTRDIGNVGRGARMYDDSGNLTELGKAFRDG